MKNTMLATEVCNRYLALPPADRVDVLATIMRLTVEVTRELEQDGPEAVNEFLRLCAAQPGGMH
jgi:hypothetical protein